MSALTALKEKKKQWKRINSKMSAKLSLGFHFEFNTIFLTVTILTLGQIVRLLQCNIKNQQKSLESH